jgi:acetate kinase
MKILVLNSGSSTLKTTLYEIAAAPPDDPPAALWEDLIEWQGSCADIRTSSLAGVRSQNRIQTNSRKQVIEQLLSDLWTGAAPLLKGASEISVVGHRIVHGGEEFSEPAIVTPRLKDVVRRMSEFAPLHNPYGLEGIEIVEEIMSGVPQVAVFDTAFHRTLPESASVYAGPYEWLARGIRRYGFHGINHQYCAQRAARMLGRDLRSLKLVTCHLGNGCSLAAVRGGRSVDTTMGFTPLEGLMMGTRAGSIDPGILIYLMRQDHLTADQLDELLNKRSGLAGVSGISNDMREVVSAMNGGNSRAKLAFDIFIYRLTSLIGSMVTVLGGIDALVFTAGIGENSAEVRSATCATLEFLGARLDLSKNLQAPRDGDISTSDSRIRILVIRAEEDWAIARACWALGHGSASSF